ncbi:hypothetical protein AK812_SmicGene35878 [Symbiodinium microadriaticum]|uniref:Uncharacterized protein n=1 Tax=Symbiodinium microadriaticum TaxID=2951 RepID=A0A1Q9CKA4_SYMMI|nr:hypothetical protein AK812_SmicGene35878 [Symbiodinium microadriaticum]
MAATTTVHVEAETTAGVETKEFLGYLWPVSLLKAYEKPVPKRLQSITHLGKKVATPANEDSDDEQAFASMEQILSTSAAPWAKASESEDDNEDKRASRNRELEKSEAIALEYQQFRAHLSAEGRLAEDLAGIYMESVRASGPGAPGCILAEALAKNKTGVFYAAVSTCPIGIQICGLKAITAEALLKLLLKSKDGALEVMADHVDKEVLAQPLLVDLRHVE